MQSNQYIIIIIIIIIIYCIIYFLSFFLFAFGIICDLDPFGIHPCKNINSKWRMKLNFIF